MDDMDIEPKILAAHDLSDQIVEELLYKAGYRDVDPVLAAFSTMIYLIHFLVEMGYTKEELVADVEWHADNQLNADATAGLNQPHAV